MVRAGTVGGVCVWGGGALNEGMGLRRSNKLGD